MRPKLCVSTAIVGVAIMIGLTGCGTVISVSARTAANTTSMSGFLAFGARSGAVQDAWVLGNTALAVTRDGGQSWDQLPLPTGSATAINDVSVLPGETVAVTGAGGEAVTISTFAAGGSAWNSSQAIQLSLPIGGAQVVDASGVLMGIMITGALGPNASEGEWLYTPDGGSTWQVLPAPVGGWATEAGGALWLVGGLNDSYLYESDDQGATWQEVALPLGTSENSQALGMVQTSGAGVVLTATNTLADGTTQVEVLEGTSSSSGWNWTAGPTVGVDGDLLVGSSAASSVADGVLWVMGSGQKVDLVTLSTGQVSTVNGAGLPGSANPLGVVGLYAISSTSAWATYSTTSCAGQRGEDCTTTNGLVMTTDGGSDWSAVSDPLQN